MSNIRYCEVHQKAYLAEKGCKDCDRSESAQRLSAAIDAARNPPPGDYYIATNDSSDPQRYTVTRPLLNMNRQDLMEQLDFRPDDGRVT